VEIKRLWANWDILLRLRTTQPVHLLKDYFGAQLAFLLAWIGFYCKALTALAPIALICIPLSDKLIFPLKGDHGPRKEQMLGFSIILVIWGQLAADLWAREQAWLVSHWDILAEEGNSQQRFGFHGDLQPSRIDGNMMERFYPLWKRRAWQTLSNLTLMLFCVLVFLCTSLWVELFGQDMDYRFAFAMYSQITILEVIHTSVITCLVEKENHKLQSQHYESLLMKQCIFRMANSYSPFLHLLLMQKDCGEEGCVALLRYQLKMTLACKIGFLILRVVFMSTMVKVLIWIRGIDAANGASCAERQRSYGKFEVMEQIEVMLQSVTALGFVLLFGSVEPLLVPICLLVFLVNALTTAVFLTDCTRRPFPRRMAGIGKWSEALNLLSIVGVITNGVLTVYYGESFHGTDNTARLAGLFLYCMLAVIIRWVTEAILPLEDESRKLLEARRRRVLQVLTQRATEGMTGVYLGLQRLPGTAKHAEAVAAGSWAELGHRME